MIGAKLIRHEQVQTKTALAWAALLLSPVSLHKPLFPKHQPPQRYQNRGIKETVPHFHSTICVTTQYDSQPLKMSYDINNAGFDVRVFKLHCRPTVCAMLNQAVPTTGEELWSDGGNVLALERLGVGALGVLDHNVPLLEPTQQPLKVAVTQQVRCLKLPEKNKQTSRNREEDGFSGGELPDTK